MVLHLVQAMIDWFDIILPTEGSTVIADYEWSLTNDGKHILEEKGVPTEFAGVMRNTLTPTLLVYIWLVNIMM